MSASPQPADLVVSQLNTAKQLTISQPEIFVTVYKQILPIINNPNQVYPVRQWGVHFMYDTFINNINSSLKSNERVELAIDSLDALIFLIDLPTNLQHQHQQLQQQGQQSKIQTQHLDVDTFRQLIDISTIVYKLVFRYVSENDNCNQIWSKLTELKNSLVNKFQTPYPLEKADSDENDLKRNIGTKLDLLKFLMTVIDFQSKTQIIGEPINGGGNGGGGYSLNNVRPDHSLIKYQNMEYEASTLFSLVLKVFSLDIIIPPLVTATLNHSVTILKKKPQLITPLLKAIENYDTNSKLQSNYQSLESYKLAKKYVDRSIRILISFAKKAGLIPSAFKSVLEQKMNLLLDRGNELRKMNIFNKEEPNVRKRKFEGFYSASKKIKVLDYAHLYTLLGSNDPLNKFDISAIANSGMVATMVLNALRKASVQRLTKALEIVGERYKDAVSKPIHPVVSIKRETDSLEGFGTGKRVGTTVEDGVEEEGRKKIKREKKEYDKKGNGADEEDEEDAFDDDFDEEEDGFDEDEFKDEPLFSLPPPKDLSFEDKKIHLSIIIDNFFKLAKAPPVMTKNNGISKETLQLKSQGEEEPSISEQLKEVAIKSFNKDTWVLLLTRLATRGMRTKAEEDGVLEKSPDDENRSEMSNMIRDALFNYFVENIHSRVDVVIEWLSEEWFSEQVFQQDRLLSKTDKTVFQVSTNEVSTPIYDKWANKVLDATINYIEPSDKKIFIRLLSDLPALNKEMLHKIKSLCYDPARSNIGFLALQFLAMYRPPVKEICIDILKELKESDQEDLKEEAEKKLARL
ncbi:hypothetical protein KGF56_002038 [Candida oxycetoniae]|uniref:Symplekin/Pta1 N-terminal domain-containing protein n=1 Tax=Candida oxycetoniae TaxID=497107 RepID=A0AAI9SYS7_9ASCO|nr:uncharacterized protein KGF56_002038 [Candida oxycetoniae]KAI3405082.2 hypothetical protein KGF56_002038 [Candida oxycetoniae]